MTDEITRVFLEDQNCTTDAAYLLRQMVGRSTMRLVVLDSSTVDSIALWTLLRWERTIAILVMERLTTHVDQLEKELAVLLDGKADQALFADHVRRNVLPEVAQAALTSFVAKARQQAVELHNKWIGTEHLLLSALTTSDSALAALLSGYGIRRNDALTIVRELLANR